MKLMWKRKLFKEMASSFPFDAFNVTLLAVNQLFVEYTPQVTTGNYHQILRAIYINSACN